MPPASGQLGADAELEVDALARPAVRLAVELEGDKPVGRELVQGRELLALETLNVSSCTVPNMPFGLV